MDTVKNIKISRLSLLFFSALIMACGGGGGGGGGVGSAAVNSAPVLDAIGPQTVLESESLMFVVSASDPDGDTVTLSATGLSGGASFNSDTGAFAWTPALGAAGTVEVTFTASDGELADSETVTISVTAFGLAAPESEAAGASGINDTSATADLLPHGFMATGDLSLPGDVDFWSISATADTVIAIELFGTRMDQQGWGAEANVPRLSLMAQDGASILLEHDQAAFFWGSHDLDIPRFRVPASGTYFLSITQENPLLGGGRYALKVTSVNIDILQFETEPEGVSGSNDTADTAEPIEAGTMSGFHVDLASDVYAFAVAVPSIACFEITAHRNGIADRQDLDYTDLELSIYDTDGITPLANSDDGYFFDPALCYGFETPGIYFVEVTNFFGIGDGEYFLDFKISDTRPGAGTGIFETEPNDEPLSATPISYGQIVGGSLDAGIGADEADLFFFSGTAGDMVRVQQFDAMNLQEASGNVSIEILAPDGVTRLPDDFNGPAGLQVTRTVLQASGAHFVRVNSLAAAGTTPYRFSLELYKTATYETEPNGTIATADSLSPGGQAAGVISTAGDEDYYSFSATRNQVVTLLVYAAPAGPGDASDGFTDFSGHGSLLQPVVTVRDALGVPLSETSFDPAAALVTGESVANGLATLGVTFVSPSTGDFMVTVAESRAGEGSEAHYYVIERR